MSSWSTPSKPIQDRTKGHNDPKHEHNKKKWWTSSTWPHPKTQWHPSASITPRNARFDLVCKWLRNNRQAKIDTFKETSLCQIKLAFCNTWGFSWFMSIAYTHEQSSFWKGPVTTAKHDKNEAAKKHQTVTTYTPLEDPPPTPTTSYATANDHPLPPNHVRTCL